MTDDTETPAQTIERLTQQASMLAQERDEARAELQEVARVLEAVTFGEVETEYSAGLIRERDEARQVALSQAMHLADAFLSSNGDHPHRDLCAYQIVQSIGALKFGAQTFEEALASNEKAAAHIDETFPGEVEELRKERDEWKAAAIQAKDAIERSAVAVDDAVSVHLTLDSGRFTASGLHPAAPGTNNGAGCVDFQRWDEIGNGEKSR